MINYILQVLLFQVLFLAVYDFFLHKETFFKWNRLYLLFTPILAFVIPFLKFESIQKSVPTQYIEQLPAIFLNPEAVILQTVKMDSSINFILVLFYVGIALFSILFLVKLVNIIKLIVTNEVIKKQNFNLVLLTKNSSAFSFFNYIFIKKDFIDKKELSIIQHELVHSKQLHTLDLLFFELLKIIMWFNPLIYVYQNRITLLHEYISDAEVVKETDKNDYFNTLLSETFKVENISFINQFFKHSLIKKRIAMITKNKSQRVKKLKYLLIVPLLLGMLFYSSCNNNANEEISDINSIIENDVVTKKGNYFTGKNGIIIFTGTELDGQIISYEAMTEKEKKISNNFKKNERNGIEHSLILEENGSRVHFIKIPEPPAPFPPVTPKNRVISDGIPFAVIENVPIFPGCEGTKEELRTCLQEKITEHVTANFNADLAKKLGLSSGVKRIFVMFEIDKEGNITNIQARAPHKDLQEEAIRVISSLPQMTPGKQKGKVVGVKYSLPIAFKVD